MKTVIMSLILFFGLIFFGCIGTNGPEQPPDPPGANIDVVEKFVEAGCTKTSNFDTDGVLYCENAGAISKFGCFDDTYFMSEEALGLDPELTLFNCWTEAYYLTSDEQEDYFYCSGGLPYACYSYLTYYNGEFIEIKNSEELSNIISPIDSEEEALNYVLISEPVFASFEKEDQEFNYESEKVGDNFLVKVYYASPVFGCYDEVNYYAIEYEVTPEGLITKLSEEIVYTEQLEYMICVD